MQLIKNVSEIHGRNSVHNLQGHFILSIVISIITAV